MAGIFIASSLPGKDLPFLFYAQDVVFHALVYAGLGWLFARALCGTRPSMKHVSVVALTVLFTSAYGVSDELHQLFVPGRACSLFDYAVDSAGGIAGGALYSWLSSSLFRR